MSVFIAQIKEGKLDFATEFNEARFNEWMRKHNGAPVKIMTNDAKSTEARNYYFGALIPTIATHHNSEDYEFWHEILKQEFNGKRFKRKDGTWGKVGMSTKKLNKHNFAEYLTKITGWMCDQGIPVPDSELWKQYRDSAPVIGEELE